MDRIIPKDWTTNNNSFGFWEFQPIVITVLVYLARDLEVKTCSQWHTSSSKFHILKVPLAFNILPPMRRQRKSDNCVYGEHFHSNHHYLVTQSLSKGVLSLVSHGCGNHCILRIPEVSLRLQLSDWLPKYRDEMECALVSIITYFWPFGLFLSCSCREAQQPTLKVKLGYLRSYYLLSIWLFLYFCTSPSSVRRKQWSFVRVLSKQWTPDFKMTFLI